MVEWWNRWMVPRVRLLFCSLCFGEASGKWECVVYSSPTSRAGRMKVYGMIDETGMKSVKRGNQAGLCYKLCIC